MQTVTLTNDPVRLSFLRAVLHDAGIECWVLDEFASSMDGSIGAIPRLDDASGCELLPRQVEFDEVHAVVPFWARAV